MGKSCPLLMRGDVVSLELEDGRRLEIPESWGLLHDTTGECLPRCHMVICKYTTSGTVAGRLGRKLADTVSQYYGSGAKLEEGSVAIPRGPWKLCGRVVGIYYQREGERGGYYHHPFESPVLLQKQTRGESYRLVLPSRCVVDDRGFVWP